MVWFLLIVATVFGVVIYRSHTFQQYLASEGIRPPLTKSELYSLQKHFAYYRSLPPRSQRIFAYRVKRFQRLTEFVPRQMSEVSSEMEVLISACAVQIAFGFDDVFLAHFERIIVYPDQFWSNADQRYHKGEVNPAMGVIVISWKHFVEGYAEDEGLNLGLHEMAHALQLENIIMNDEFGFMEDGPIKIWQELAIREMEEIRSGRSSFFREYASTNHAEFFAVAVENFFERPKEFSTHNYALYRTLAELLKQDPLLLRR
ncbi:zinc-dependent peptidase [Marinoscillum sp.]|uniref:zinc-dependent peptidase n=1 Tax=Marinoscillum sp. TaxID=2024838 RepID=UPI003BA9C5C2